MQLWVAVLERAIKVATYEKRQKGLMTIENSFEDTSDEVYQWLSAIGLSHHTSALKSKGFSCLDFIREVMSNSDQRTIFFISNPPMLSFAYSDRN